MQAPAGHATGRPPLRVRAPALLENAYDLPRIREAVRLRDVELLPVIGVDLEYAPRAGGEVEPDHGRRPRREHLVCQADRLVEIVSRDAERDLYVVRWVEGHICPF